MTESLVRVAAALLSEPFGRHWGYDLSQRSHVRSGVLYPILHRLLAEGWIQDGWEDTSEVSGRPVRRYYELTDFGRSQLGAIVARAGTDPRFNWLAPLGTLGGTSA